MARNIAVYGIYPDRASLEEGLEQFQSAGFRKADISVLFPDNAGTKEFAHEKHTKAPEGAVAGAGSGAVIGGTLGWLVGIGAIAIPGIGPFIAAGPIVAALAGVGAGGVLGGLAGSLVGMGIPEYEAKRYEGRLRSGGLLFSVHCDDNEWKNRAIDILKRTGADDVSSAGEARGDFAVGDKPEERRSGDSPVVGSVYRGDRTRSDAGWTDADRDRVEVRDRDRDRDRTLDRDPARDTIRERNYNRAGVEEERFQSPRFSKDEKSLVRDVMTSDIRVIDGSATVQEAAEMMRKLDVGFLPVSDQRRMVGVITDRDIAVRATAEGWDPARVAVERVMTRDLVCCREDDSLAAAAELMERHQIRRLPVINREEELTGMLSLGDLVTRSGDRPLAGDVLENVSQPNRR
jgi:CBS domain-containing protein